MKFVVLMATLLLCAGHLVSFFQQRDEREEESLSSIYTLTINDNVMHRFNGNKNPRQPKTKRKYGKPVWQLLQLLLSAIIFSSAIQALGRQTKFKALLQVDPVKELVQTQLESDLDLNNLLALSPNKTTLNCHSNLAHFRIYSVFPAHFQKLFQEERPRNHTEANRLNLMRCEWARYASFKDFPKECPAMPNRLAAAGFYYVGPADKVQCFSCKLLHNDWQVTDIPLEIHRRLSPNCKFLSDSSDGNLSIHDDNRDLGDNIQTHAHCTMGESLSPNMNSNEGFDSCESRVDLDETDPTAHCKHPQYKELPVRQSSFSRWPCWDVQNPRNLAEAGFFYAGFSDCVRCFCCGIGLRNWEHGDGALSEHARWSEDCLYLNRKIGCRRIEQIREDDFDVPPSKSKPVSTPLEMKSGISEIAFSCTRGPQTSAKSNEKDLTYERQRTGVIDAVTKAVEMGFDKKIVETALQKYQSGNTPEREEPITCEKLLDMILQIENSERPICAVSTRSDVTEAVGSSTQENTTSSFVDKLPSDDKLSIARFDSALSLDCLRDENRRLKEQLVCKICIDKEANMILLPCGHMISCEMCAPELRKCPICRHLVKKRIKAYLA